MKIPTIIHKIRINNNKINNNSKNLVKNLIMKVLMCVMEKLKIIKVGEGEGGSKKMLTNNSSKNHNKTINLLPLI